MFASLQGCIYAKLFSIVQPRSAFTCKALQSTQLQQDHLWSCGGVDGPQGTAAKQPRCRQDFVKKTEGIPLIGISDFEVRIKNIGLCYEGRLFRPRILTESNIFNCTKQWSWEYTYVRYAVGLDLSHRRIVGTVGSLWFATPFFLDQLQTFWDRLSSQYFFCRNEEFFAVDRN